jgi:hypothetical protein
MFVHRLPYPHVLKNPIDRINLEIQIAYQAEVETVDKRDCVYAKQRRPIHPCCPGALILHALRNDFQEHQQLLLDRHHRLSDWMTRLNSIRPMRRRIRHTSCYVIGAKALSFEGKCLNVFMLTVVRNCIGKSVGQDSALQKFSERLVNTKLGGMLVALAVELASAYQLKPGLKGLCYSLINQSKLGTSR